MSRKTDILDFIQKFSQEKGYSPTIREIGSGIGLSPLLSIIMSSN